MDIVFLAQSDTTAGFLSINAVEINNRKKANTSKALLKEIPNLKNQIHRIPCKHRRFVRYAKKTTFIVKNFKPAQNLKNAFVNTQSFRVVKDSKHNDFLQGFKYLYSSSANPTGRGFDMDFALKNCDVVVLDKRVLSIRFGSLWKTIVPSGLYTAT